MHRDISGGNVLIVPIIVEVPSGVFIVCRGVLTDWEMSKPITPGDEPNGPRQPERTVSILFAIFSGSC